MEFLIKACSRLAAFDCGRIDSRLGAYITAYTPRMQGMFDLFCHASLWLGAPRTENVFGDFRFETRVASHRQVFDVPNGERGPTCLVACAETAACFAVKMGGVRGRQTGRCAPTCC